MEAVRWNDWFGATLEHNFLNSAGVRIPRLILTHQRRLKTSLLLAAAVLPLGAILAATFLSDWRAKRNIIFYFAPLLLTVALWMRERLGQLDTYTRRAFAVDGFAFALAAARLLTTALPLSGHMLVYLYIALTIRGRVFRVLAWVLALETTYFKLVLWSDPITWAGGIMVGLALAALYRRWAAQSVSEDVGAQVGVGGCNG